MPPATLTDQDWLRVFESVADRIREAVLPLLGTDTGRAELGRGAGGDRTMELDHRAEETALAELRGVAVGRGGFSLLSEEAGLVDLGADWPRVLLDPVDGSLNAKRGLPVVGTMLALLRGPTLGDVRTGHVLNLISGERWQAVRAHGALHDGRPIRPMRPGPPGRIEVLALESGPRHVLRAAPLIERAAKVRLFGSMALSMAHAAAGGVDVHCSTMPGRAFDMGASALMVSEVGGLVTDLGGNRVDGLAADLQTRTTLLASAHPDLHAVALEIMAGATWR